MAKITRYSGNLPAFASGATGTERTVFGDVTQSDVLTTNIAADFIRGWAAGLDVSGFPPQQFFNAVGFVATQLSAYLHQVGVAEWDILQEYHIGSFANVSGDLYASLTNLNVGNDPTVDAVNWKPIALPATETAPGVVELATDAEAQAFTANKFIDGAKLNTSLKGANQILSLNGKQKLHGGIIIQWGQGLTPAGGGATDTVILPEAFPNDFYLAVISNSSSTGAGGLASPPIMSAIVQPLVSLASFSIQQMQNVSHVSNYSWIAIGI